MEYVIYRSDKDHLAHHGVKGQKWGIRRYQNEDGTLTPEGQKRYAEIEKWNLSKTGKIEQNRAQKLGLSRSEAYEAHRSGRAGGLGWLVAGPMGAVVGSVVSQKRAKEGREFTEWVLRDLEKKNA